MSVEQKLHINHKQDACHYLLPASLITTQLDSLTTLSLDMNPVDSPEKLVEKILATGAYASGQGYVVCSVLIDGHWCEGHLDWNLNEGIISHFELTPVAVPSKNVRTVVICDESSIECCLELVGCHNDLLIIESSSKSNIHFTSGYQPEEIELWHRLFLSSVPIEPSFLQGNIVVQHGYDSLYETFDYWAKQQPTKTAIISDEGAISYRCLSNRVKAMALFLSSKVISGQAIAVYLERDINQIIVTLACHAVGCAVVPIYYDSPLSRVEQMIEQAQCQAVIVTEEKSDSLTISGQKVVLESLLYGVEGVPLSTLEQFIPTPVSLDEINYVYFTSGSEGVPKGVALRGDSISRLVNQPDFIGNIAEQVVSYLANPAFDASALELWAAFCNGATLALFNKNDVLDIDVLATLMKTFEVTTSFFTSGLFNRIADINPALFAQLSFVMFGGEKVSIRHVKNAVNRTTDTVFIHCYGPTENGIFTTTHTVDRETLHQYRDLSIGRPIAGTDLAVLDNNLNIVPQGQVGQLACFGTGLAEGYIGMEALTQERFVNLNGRKVYLTGDYVRLSASQQIDFIGRIDSQIKLNGFRIELGEIELILKQHPDLNEAYVRMCPTLRQIQAFVVGAAVKDITSLWEKMSDLPSYMQPSHIQLIDSIPLNPNGKVDQKALDTLYIEHIEQQEESQNNSALMAEILSIYQRVLYSDVRQIDKSLFELGGNSLHLMQLLSELRKSFSPTLKLPFLIENSSPQLVFNWAEKHQLKNKNEELQQEWVF